MALPFFRKIGQILPGASNPSGGTQYRMELPRTALHQRIHLHFYGTYSQTTGGGTALTEQPHRYIRLIEVIANGSNVVKQMTAAALYRVNHFDHGVAPVSPTGAIAAGTSEDVHFELQLDFAMPRSIRPIDTLLDARKFSLLELVVTVGDVNDLFSSPSGTQTLAIKGDVYIEELVGLDSNFGIYREVEQIKSFSSVSGDQEIQLPTGDFYRGLTLRLLNSSNNPVDLLAGTGGHEISLRSGATEFVRRIGWGNAAVAASSDSAFSGLLGQNQNQYGITVPDGYRRLDFAKDGLLTEALDSGALEELVLVFGMGTSAGSGELRTIQHTIVNPQFVRA